MGKAAKPEKAAWHDDEDAIALYHQVCDVLETTDLAWVESKADVRQDTMYRWLRGETYLPQMRTLFRVAKVLGFTITATRAKTADKVTPKRRHLYLVK